MTPEKKTTIVCMGDGITKGFGLEDVTCTYPFLLQEALQEGYEVFNKGASYSCVGISQPNGQSQSIPYVKQGRCKEALALCGDIYVIMLGTNDALDTANPDDNLFSPPERRFRACYQEILDEIRAAAPRALTFIVTPMPISPSVENGQAKLRLNQLLPHIDMVAAGNRLPLVDLHSELSRLQEAELAAIYQDDGIHPNVNGTMLIASILAYAIGNREY